MAEATIFNEDCIMKKYISLLAAFAVLFSCVEKEPEQVLDDQEAPVENIVSIFANAPSPHSEAGEDESSSSQPQQSQATRTQLVDGTNVQWTPGDKIKMCFDVKTWQTDNVWTGVEFENVSGSVSEFAAFKGSVDVNNVQDYGFVVYPTTFKFDSRTYGPYGENYTTTISHVLPSAQPAVEGTFASNLNLSYAPVTKKQVSENISSKTPINVTFKNMCISVRRKILR